MQPRPTDVQTPGPGQESVWEYPRPPRVDREDRSVEIRFNGNRIAATEHPVIVRETAGAPVFFLPRDAVEQSTLRRSNRTSFCEWKGGATYYDVVVGDKTAEAAAFEYEDPDSRFDAIRDHIAFYAGPMDEVTVDGERAKPQPGGFYAGWVLPWVVGPVKGEPGTQAW